MYSLLLSETIGAFDSFLIFATVEMISCSFGVNELSGVFSTFSTGLRSPAGATATATAALAIVDVAIEGVTLSAKKQQKQSTKSKQNDLFKINFQKYANMENILPVELVLVIAFAFAFVTVGATVLFAFETVSDGSFALVALLTAIVALVSLFSSKE